MTRTPLVSIGLVTWNSARHLEACLEAVAAQRCQDFDLVCVDNASEDGSAERVASLFPAGKLVRNRRNEGFCGAHNEAIRRTRAPFYLPLNPDVVLEPGYLEAMVSALQAHPACGTAAGKLLQGRAASGRAIIDSTGLFIDRTRRQYLRGHGEEDVGQYDLPGEVFGADGAAPLYRRAMLEDVQVEGQAFDEAFFAHKEDVDLAWRAQLAGWRCRYVPDAVAWHPRAFRPGWRNRAAVPRSVRAHAIKNRYLMLLKNETAKGLRRDGLRIAWYDLKVLAYLALFERSSLAAFPQLAGDWRRARAWRREISRRRRVDPAELLAWFHDPAA